jgi:hypothetical protein
MADMGYALKSWCQSGFRAPEIFGVYADHRSSYNGIYSGLRTTVERAIGILKSRFHTLLFGLNLRDRKSNSIVFFSLCIVHNLCLSASDFMDEDEITAAIKVERETRKAYEEEERIATIEGGAGNVPVQHPASLAAGRLRRRQVAAELGLNVGV